MSDDEAIVAWKEDDEGVEIRVNSPTSGEKESGCESVNVIAWTNSTTMSVGSEGSSNADDEKRVGSKKASLCSTLSSGDHPYLSLISSTSRSRKVSEGMNPMMTMFGHSESVDQPVFNVIEEESWKGTNSIYGPGNANIPLNKKLTRQRKEIFPGYEKLVQERSKTSCDEREEHQEEEKVPEENVMSLKVIPQKKIIRRNSFNPPSSHSLSPARQQATNCDSDPAVGPQFTRRGLRATVGASEIKDRSRLTAGDTEGQRAKANVSRSNSSRTFLKLGDGFLKTFRNIKRK